jgi:FKBP-type peptidyl-prolyl cis-trans isomerase
MRRRLAPAALVLALLPGLPSTAETPAATPAPASPAPAATPAAIPAPPDVAAPPADATLTASGLASKVLVAGQGPQKPGPADTVKVHYTGWTTDGKMFDSSVAKGEPAVLPVDRVIAGWSEALQLMTEGEKRRIWVPAKLAYEGRPGRPQGMLVFDVELLDVLRAPDAPADVAAAPADAEVTRSGLASKRLQAGTGSRRPKPASYVEVHYTGWTTDGRMFDSSMARGVPATFQLTKVIPGWTEGLQLMVEGETRRFWIPEKLAYRGKHGFPRGMLVFDVELIRIVRD